MKRIILQHWDGPPSQLEEGSWRNIANYAKRIGVEHRVLSGQPLGPLKNSQLQKLHMLSATFDSYDTVVMMDSDMFAVPGLRENIFQVSGIGVATPLQETIRGSLRRALPKLFGGKALADYFGGAIYKLERAERIKFRPLVTPKILAMFDDQRVCLDEGVMHYIATMTRTNGRGLPGGEKWACSSFHPDVKKAKIVHIRRRWRAGREERRPKMESFNRLVAQQVLAPWT